MNIGSALYKRFDARKIVSPKTRRYSQVAQEEMQPSHAVGLRKGRYVSGAKILYCWLHA